MIGQVFPGSKIIRGIMRPFFVVFSYPVFRSFPDLIQRSKHIHIQNLISIGTIESFYIGVLCWFTWLDKFQLNPMFLSLFRQNRRGKLRTIIHSQFVRITSPCHQPFQYPYDSWSRQVQIYLNGQRLPIKIIYHVKSPESSATKQAVAHKIHRPTLIRHRRHTQRLRVTTWQSLLAFAPLV